MKEYYNLDLETIKSDIKTFFESSTEFNTYNFEGSGISQLLNPLAFITQYIAFYLNQNMNELTLKNAEIRTQILELANMLNYLPKRKSAPYINVNIQRTEAVTIIIPKFSEWLLNGTISLTNLEDITINDDSVQNIVLHEGALVTETSISDGSDFLKIDLSNSEKVDNDNLSVYIDVPVGDGTYTLGTTSWTNVNSESFVSNSDCFYIQYFDDLSIKFDNGNLFNKPNEDDRVRIEYLLTNGTTYNSQTGTITCSDLNVTNNDKLTITPTNVLQNGTDEESNEEIKLRAPLFYVTHGRAITEADYNILIQKWSKYSTLDSTSCWGGEKEYLFSANRNIVESSFIKDLGHVYISALKSDYDFLTSTEIQEIKDYFDPYKIQTIFIKFLDPVIVNVTPNVNLQYNSVINFNVSSVETAINTYLSGLNSYNTTFYLSKLVSFIQQQENVNYTYVDYDSSITLKHSEHKVIRLNNRIKENSISGTVNGYTITDVGGNIIWNGSAVGSINYSTGFITLDTTFNSLAEGTEYSFNFAFYDLESFTLEKESFLKFNNINLNTI